MFTLCVKDSFAAAHRLIGYEGKCEDLHGHNFVVEAFFSGGKLGDDGLLVDFKILKDYLKDVLDNLDHKYLNEIPYFVETASSAEYIALYIFGEVEKQMKGKAAVLKEIRVWESDKAYAAYGR
jgi:6-pyruvoyltetrahydropterin/6-carboxytetrahydropterin synthase